MRTKTTSRERFVALFENHDVTAPEAYQDYTIGTYSSYNGVSKARIPRAAADDLVAGIERARDRAAHHAGYSANDLAVWDEYWQGIGNALRQYREPHVTIKQLLWCYRSFTKSGSHEIMPPWLMRTIQELRQLERTERND